MTPDDADNEFENLKQLPVSKLHERFENVYGESPRSRNKVWLVRKILWRLQSFSDGDLSKRALLRAAELAVNADVRLMPAKRAVAIKVKISKQPDPTAERLSHDHRLPLPGQSIVRDYNGQHIEVRVTPDGFEYDGERYKSLSAIAKSITGSHCNGFRFFQLRNR